MKKILLFSLIATLVLSCKNETETKIDYTKETLDVTTSTYPENISKVFDAHGGLDHWNSFESLVFEIEKPEVNEKTTTTLKNRESLIEMKDFAIGYDGKEVWLQKKDTMSYKGNPKFYYNLMFYFYAMPFIVADDGINYKDVEPLEFDGVSYPGILISYEAGVGESPDDEYIVYYNPETYQMEWLGYTVTYFSKEKSKEFHFIKYNDWQTVDGLQLPKTLTWYNYENNKPTEKRNDMQFVNIKLSKDKMDTKLFAMPEDAEVVE